MTQTKHCYACSITRPTTDFSKCKKSKDSLQPKCKECNKLDNQKFRVHLKIQRNLFDEIPTNF